MDPIVARKTSRTLEPFHSIVYFAPEATEEYARVGVTDWGQGYFGSRAAAMGAVAAPTVTATFFNFAPVRVEAAVPAVWEHAAPAQLLAARLAGIDRTLRRLLGDQVGSPDVAEAAALAREAAEACIAVGRPLYAAHAALPWPDDDHLALWHAVTLLREFRGDGHVAALVLAGVGAVEALLLHEATGAIPPGVLQASRGWSNEEWAAAGESLRTRGFVDDAGGLTAAGVATREALEAQTDEAGLRPFAALGEDRSDRLRSLVRPLSKAIVAGGDFFRTP